MIGKRISMICIWIMLIPLSATADSMDAVDITATPLTPQIFMLAGKGGNLGVFTGTEGTFLIDDQFAPLTPKILSAIEKIGGHHPRFLINTHYHGDHTGGNENLGRKGTLIVAHDNVRDRLEAGSFIQEFDMKRSAVDREGLPVVTFSADISFHLNGDRVRAIHVAHAHTDGDSIIHFTDANVIHAGDIVFNGFYPFIDVSHGGSLKGMLNAVDQILALADDNTKIIPGHGPLADKPQLRDYRKMLATAYERLNKLKADGKSAQEAVAAKPLADLEDAWGDGIFTGDRWIEIIYAGV